MLPDNLKIIMKSTRHVLDMHNTFAHEIWDIEDIIIYIINVIDTMQHLMEKDAFYNQNLGFT